MEWSRESFERGCVAYVEAVRCCFAESNRRPLLRQWEIGRGDKRSCTTGDLYLYHPGIRRCAPKNSVKDSENDDLAVLVHTEQSELHEDPDVSPVPQLPCDEDCYWEWHLSVAYSDTWRSPVLYFHVHEEARRGGGPVCARQSIVDFLTALHHQNQVAESWDFVSQDEHPITGLPSFFLHPCRTNERLAHLVANQQMKCASTPDAVRVLRWMALLLPSVGLALSSSDFVQLEKHCNKNV
jgi:hypothetical protein